MVHPRVLEPRPVFVDAEAAYERWVTRNRNRYGSALRDAFLSGFLAAHASGPDVSTDPDPWEAL